MSIHDPKKRHRLVLLAALCGALVFDAVIVLGTALATGVLSWPGPRRKA